MKLDIAFVDAISNPKGSDVIYVLIDTTLILEGNKGNILWLSNLIGIFYEKRFLYSIPVNELILNPDLIQNTRW